jgi:hypothetical protein
VGMLSRAAALENGLQRTRTVVPSKGLEPPHPCEYMDLNHARLPIPPRWHKKTGMRHFFSRPPSRKDYE